MLTDVVIGAWTSAFFLDIAGGKRAQPAADTLVGLGLLAAVPTVAAGLVDWSDTSTQDKRVGVVHALSNTAASVLYAWSYLARRRGRRGRGVALGMLGATAATVGGHLGGHLSYRRGVNVDRNAWSDGPTDWIRVTAESELPDGTPVLVEAEGAQVLLVRDGERVRALGDVCSHAGGPLHEGEISDGCVTCPWHGSTFRLDDGTVMHGPATAPQPVYDARVDAGKFSVRRRG